MYALKWETLVILLSEENGLYECAVSEWEFPFLHFGKQRQLKRWFIARLDIFRMV